LNFYLLLQEMFAKERLYFFLAKFFWNARFLLKLMNFWKRTVWHHSQLNVFLTFCVRAVVIFGEFNRVYCNRFMVRFCCFIFFEIFVHWICGIIDIIVIFRRWFCPNFLLPIFTISISFTVHFHRYLNHFSKSSTKEAH
jgi:hypothetical protein